MSNIKITDLPELTSVTNDDLLIIVDSGNPYVTKKIAWKNIGVPSGAITDAPSGTITYGRRNNQWVDLTAPANLQIRRGTQSEVSGIIPLQGEPVWITDKKVLTVGDGSTSGGIAIGASTFIGYAENTDHYVFQVDDPAQLDPKMQVLLRTAGVYYIKISTVFTRNNYGDFGEGVFFAYFSPYSNVTAIHGIDATDLGDYESENAPITVGASPLGYDKEFTIRTLADNITFGLKLGESEESSGLVTRGNGYMFAIKLS